MLICPDGVIPALQFDEKECISTCHHALDISIEPINCTAINLSLHNYPSIDYRIFYKQISQQQWQYLDTDDTMGSPQSRISSTRSHDLSLQTDWGKSPTYVINRFPTMPQIPTTIIKDLLMNTVYQICVAPKFTPRLKRKPTNMTSETPTFDNLALLEDEPQKTVEIMDEDEKKKEAGKLEDVRSKFNGISSEILTFRTPSWKFDIGTVDINGIIFSHAQNHKDTVGSSMGHDSGVHHFKIEFQDLTGGGMNNCAFGIVGHHVYNNASGNGEWMSHHDHDVIYLTDSGYICYRNNTTNNKLICDQTDMKWVNVRKEEVINIYQFKQMISMTLDCERWRVIYRIGDREYKIEDIKPQKYFPCVSAMRNICVKILSD